MMKKILLKILFDVDMLNLELNSNNNFHILKNSNVSAQVAPFAVNYFSRTTIPAGTLGFKLMFMQIPC